MLQAVTALHKRCTRAAPALRTQSTFAQPDLRVLGTQSFQNSYS